MRRASRGPHHRLFIDWIGIRLAHRRRRPRKRRSLSCCSTIDPSGKALNLTASTSDSVCVYEGRVTAQRRCKPEEGASRRASPARRHLDRAQRDRRLRPCQGARRCRVLTLHIERLLSVGVELDANAVGAAGGTPGRFQLRLPHLRHRAYSARLGHPARESSMALEIHSIRADAARTFGTGAADYGPRRKAKANVIFNGLRRRGGGLTGRMA